MKRNNTTSRTIHNLLQHIVIDPPEFIDLIMGQPQSVFQKLQPIREYLRNDAPRRLFRLRKYSKESIDALKNDNLYLTLADHFNDPFDILVDC